MHYSSHSAQQFPRLNTVIVAGLVLGSASLFLNQIFANETDAPLWYDYASYALGIMAHLGSGLLCLRNWQYSRLVSDRNIWLCFGIGCFCYVLGDFFFGYWELVLAREPDISLGDPFYVASRVFWVLGIILAIKFRGISLNGWQGATLALISAIAIWFSWSIVNSPEVAANGDLPQVQVFASSTSELDFAQQLNFSMQLAQNREVEIENNVPTWALAVEKTLEPAVETINLVYVVGDVLILIMAMAIVLTFWGGRFSQTWSLIAIAFFLLYIADIIYAYVVVTSSYESNIGVFDSFWTISGILIAIGAAKEYDISISRRSS